MAGNNYYQGNNYVQEQSNQNGQWRSSGQESQPQDNAIGYAGNLQRFSYPGQHYGFQFNGPYDHNNQSHGVPQSDVRTQRNGENSSQYGAPTYPSPPAPPQNVSPYGFSNHPQQQQQQQQSQAQSRDVSNPASAQYRAHSAQQYQSRTLPVGKTMTGSAQNVPNRATQTSSPAAYQQAARAPPAQQAHHPQQTQDAMAPQTVDPSQFHDSYYAMQRRKAAEAEAEARREESARSVVEERVRHEVEEKSRADAAAQTAAEDKLRADAHRKADMEREMKEMFLKLRQYHEQDPELLSKMWANEREQHLAGQASDPSPLPIQSVPAPAAEQPTTAKPKKRPKKRGPRIKATPATGKSGKKTNQALPSEAAAPTDANSAQKPQVATQPQRVDTVNSQSLLQTPSAPVLAQPGAASTSKPIWPVDKKASLSAAASRLILAVPENQGKTLTPKEVSAILDQNPTYVDLCDAIEQRGLKFSRAALAKCLLGTIPEKSAGKPAAAASASSPAPLSPVTGNVNAAIPPHASPSPSENSAITKPANKKKIKVVATPQTKEDLARKRYFGDLVDLTQDSDAEDGGTKRARMFSNTMPAESNATWLKPDPQPPQAPASKKASALPDDHPLKTHRMAQPLNRRDAKRRSKYNVTTIARDVLLSTGRHPEMRPLNAHLDTLKGMPLKVPDEVDLSTLRWDLIDPGGVAPGYGLFDEAGMSDYEDDADDEENMSDSDVENSVNLSAPQLPYYQFGVPACAAGGGGERVSALTAVPAVGTHRYGPHPTSIKKRHRRRQTSPDTNSTPRQHAPGPTSTPTSAYAELRRQNEQKGLEKRRGRPVGWRKWMQKTPDGASASKPPARAPGPDSHKKLPPSPPNPTFVEFKCDWEGCTRSLHNLETLRRHVQKLHANKEGEPPMHVCKWGDCGTVETTRDGVRTISRRVQPRFEKIDEWKMHVENAHIAKVAWRLGDGPSAGLTRPSESASEQSESYLSDKDGRQVTPRVGMPTGRGFTAVNTPARRTGRPSAIEQARETLRGAEQRRNRIGYGIDHGGARSVDDSMRATLVDEGQSAEPAMEVVDEADMDFAK